MIMEKTFYTDKDFRVSYSDFLAQLKRSSRFRTYCKANTPLEFFEHIILAAINGSKITLLDSDLSDDEIKKLLPEHSDTTEELSVSDIPSTFEDIVEKIKHSDDFTLTLFTSGTTGRPKKVEHTLKSLTRFVKAGERHSDDIWGFAYNPSHIAGLQVFFQAFLNGNTIVNLFGHSREDIINAISENRVTHISATPTFYRMLLPISTPVESVKRLTSGGERFDSKTSDSLLKSFPNAKITNVYASTEAGTILASSGDAFVVKEDMRSLVKIENGELLIHNSLLGNSEAKTSNTEWFKTGDLVEILSEDPTRFKFISRKSSMINSGGYKVNPEEVEDAIRAIEGVRQVRVFGKKNSILGNIVCAEIELNKDVTLDEKTVRAYLRNKLQEFKIPRIVKFLETIVHTRTGKTDRKL